MEQSSGKVVTPDESDSDTNVSDVEVSYVSSVEVSTSEEEDSSDDNNSSVSSNYNSSDEESDAAARLNAKKEEAARKAREAKAADLNWTPSKNKHVVVEVKTEHGSDGAQALSAGKPFQRVDDQFWGRMAMKDRGAMADNSYEGTFELTALDCLN